MDTANPSTQPLKPATNWLSLFQFVLSSLAALLMLLSAGTIAISVFTGQFSPPSTVLPDPTQSLMIAASLAFAGLLVIPSAWYAGKRLAKRDKEPIQWVEPPRFGLFFSLAVLIIVAAALLLGNWASTQSRLAWFLMPPLNIIANGLPALWLMYVGTRGLISGAPSRRWGVFTSGLVLGPIVIILLEIILLVVIGILAVIWLMLDPALAGQLESLAFRLQNAASNPDAVMRILFPFISNPGLLVLIFAYIAVIVPMIEEALKPIGVWLLVGKKLSPAQGFGYGLLSGTGFGLFENLGNTSTGGELWVIVASTRISTLLLHALTAGLVGWALASAWTHKRYLRLVVTYFMAVLLHGIWNGLAVLSFFSTLDSQYGSFLPSFLQQAGSLSAAGIVALGVFNLVLLLAFNRALRRQVERDDLLHLANAPALVEAANDSPPPALPAPSPAADQSPASLPGVTTPGDPGNHPSNPEANS